MPSFPSFSPVVWRRLSGWRGSRGSRRCTEEATDTNLNRFQIEKLDLILWSRTPWKFDKLDLTVSVRFTRVVELNRSRVAKEQSHQEGIDPHSLRVSRHCLSQPELQVQQEMLPCVDFVCFFFMDSLWVSCHLWKLQLVLLIIFLICLLEMIWVWSLPHNRMLGYFKPRKLHLYRIQISLQWASHAYCSHLLFLESTITQERTDARWASTGYLDVMAFS